MAKTGPKPSPDAMRKHFVVRMEDKKHKFVTSAGTADLWRPILEQVAGYAVQYRSGAISPEQLREQLGELAEVVIEYADQEPKP